MAMGLAPHAIAGVRVNRVRHSAMIGSQSGSYGAGGDSSTTYDWGYTLVPTSLLTTQAVLGWAPGNSANPPSSAGV